LEPKYTKIKEKIKLKGEKCPEMGGVGAEFA
jgi:hypothetical protein